MLFFDPGLNIRNYLLYNLVGVSGGGIASHLAAQGSNLGIGTTNVLTIETLSAEFQVNNAAYIEHGKNKGKVFG